jgi:predicted ATPase
MRLVRVQVPEFRALKDVDISFEPEFTPQVFPLGSLNGGGKSTLLQLIFVLLHCSIQKNKFYLIKNLLENFEIKSDETQKTVAIIDVLIDGQNIQFKFFCCNDSYFKYLPNLREMDLHEYINDHKSYDECGLSLSLFSNNVFKPDDLLRSIQIDSKAEFVIIDYLESKNIFYIAKLSDHMGFFIEAHHDEIDVKTTLSELSKKIFLVSPSNQGYLFLNKTERRSLFSSDSDISYDKILKDLKSYTPNFFTYDFLDVITEVLRLARDKDFDEKLKTGVYGTHYEQLENAINSLFIDGKKIIPLTVDQKRHTKDSIQSMGFKLPSGEEIYPEDLSHGELKRLAIFVLIKYHEIHDAIVLMDEIENGFHPDWQYQIVRDLVEWGENNQYILATHSYELCNALTPAHVKELDPKLVKN